MPMNKCPQITGDYSHLQKIPVITGTKHCMDVSTYVLTTPSH